MGSSKPCQSAQTRKTIYIYIYICIYVCIYLLELLYGECDERMRLEIKKLDVVVFEGPDVLAEFRGVSVFSVAE